MKILITGANGFVGQALVDRLSTVASEQKYMLVAATRSKYRSLAVNDSQTASTDKHIGHSIDNIENISTDSQQNKFKKNQENVQQEHQSITHCVVGDINSVTDWRDALVDVDVVVHTAARVHVMRDSSDNPLTAFRAVNVDGTINLARQAAKANCKRFIFLSSIKVNGEQTYQRAFHADDQPDPQDPYAVSKLEAEQTLLDLAKTSQMEIVIIRPPLVYGVGVKANFQTMIKAVKKGLPLPLANINNKRSLVSLDNLVDFIAVCLSHPRAANQVFLISDTQDVSVSELLLKIARAYKKPVRIFSFPLWLLKFAALLLNKRDVLKRLTGSLQVDVTKNKSLLSWKPKYTLEQSLDKMVNEDLNREP